ncbi:unnamed protein product, partial [Callosobruchus maculatus]
RKIESLRNGLRRSQRKVKYSKWSGAPWQPKLWYVDLLMFIEQHNEHNQDANGIASMVQRQLTPISTVSTKHSSRSHNVSRHMMDSSFTSEYAKFLHTANLTLNI